MSAALKWAAVGLALLWGAGAAAAPLSLEWEGSLVWKVPGSTLSHSSDLSLTGELVGWGWVVECSVADGAWTALVGRAAGVVGTTRVEPSVSFVPQTPAFRRAGLSWAWPWEGGEARGLALLEEHGFGWKLEYRGPHGALVDRAAVRFNVKRFGDEVLEPTFAAPFSTAEAAFVVTPPCCVSRVRGWFSFSKSGFEELGFAFMLPWEEVSGLSFSVNMWFRPSVSVTSLSPMLTFGASSGLVVLIAPDWESSTRLLRGIRVFAFGLQGTIGDVRFRSFTSLAEGLVDFVKDPYWELLELIWNVPGCCGDGEVAVTFYFGDSGPFGLGEVEATGRIPLTAGIQLVVGLSASHAGELSVTLGGKILL